MHQQVYDGNGNHIGTFDGEYIYSKAGKMIYRIDETEIYTLDIPCRYIGVMEGKIAVDTSGTTIFHVED